MGLGLEFRLGPLLFMESSRSKSSCPSSKHLVSLATSIRLAVARMDASATESEVSAMHQEDVAMVMEEKGVNMSDAGVDIENNGFTSIGA